uniref:Transcription factor TGA2 n=1 Tax=Cajanus cajan TaxID=3821 RepID=A0A151TSX4_CAJCA|nr:Transcription factor TGA2 [Cajanus cajan]
MLASSLESFEGFHEGWVQRQEKLLALLPRLLSAESEEQQKSVIEQVLCDYQQFLEEKARLANADVFLLFSAPWLSAYERALLWIGDYKASLIVRLLEGGVEGLTAEQREGVERVREETKRAEREVSEAMASVQESMASPRMVGQEQEQEAAIHCFKEALKKLSQRADELRASTMRKLVPILSPPQTVQLLAATINFQIRLRKLGLQRDQEPSPSDITSSI